MKSGARFEEQVLLRGLILECVRLEGILACLLWLVFDVFYDSEGFFDVFCWV